MIYLSAIVVAVGLVLMVSALTAILGWLVWFWQITMLFVVIPYYAVRATLSGLRWTWRKLTRAGAHPALPAPEAARPSRWWRRARAT